MRHVGSARLPVLLLALVSCISGVAGIDWSAVLSLINFGGCSTGPDLSLTMTACAYARGTLAGGSTCISSSNCNPDTCSTQIAGCGGAACSGLLSCACVGDMGGSDCSEDWSDGSTMCGFSPADYPGAAPCQGISQGGTCKISPCFGKNTQCDSINDRCVCKPGFCMTEAGSCELISSTVTTKVAAGFAPGTQPEFELEDLVARTENVGLALSGGGNRAFSTSFGIVRTLRNLGLLEKIRVSSALSGGNWLQTILAYAPATISDDTLFAPPYKHPSALTTSDLDTVPEGSALHSTTTDFFSKLMGGLDDGRIQEMWKSACMDTYLEPYGLAEPWGQISYDADHVAAIKAANPALDGASFQQVRADRPYPISIVNLMGPETLLNDQFLAQSHLQYSYMEITPMYSCVEGGPDATMVNYIVHPGGNTASEVIGASVPVGGCVENFAWGADVPQYNMATGAASAPWSSTLEVPLPAQPLDLGFSVAASSNYQGPAMATGFSNNSLLVSLSYTGFDPLTCKLPRMYDWTMYSSPLSNAKQADPYMAVDGGMLGTSSIEALLRRGVARAISVISSSAAINLEMPDPANPRSCDVTLDLPSYFGMVPMVCGWPYFPTVEATAEGRVLFPTKMGDAYDQAHLFSNSNGELQTLMLGLIAAKREGGGVIFSQDLTTVANEKIGVQAGLKVRVTWVYLDRSWKFERELSWSQPALYADLLNAYEEADNRRPINTYMKSFPHVSTFAMDTTFTRYIPQQSLLLAELASFVANNNRKELTAAVLGSCDANCAALPDDPEVVHSTFNPELQIGAQHGMSFNVSEALVRCHIGEKSQCDIEFSHYVQSANSMVGLNCSNNVEAKLCAYLQRHTVELTKTKTSKGSAKRATDGDLDTDIKIKKAKSPYFTGKVPKSNKPHLVKVHNTNSKTKAQKALKGFEIWQGKKAGKLQVKCGGPFQQVGSVGPFTAVCPGNKKKRYVTVVVPGKEKTLNIAEVKVYALDGG